MQKLLLTLLLLGATLHAEDLSSEQIAKLLNYKHSLLGKLQHKRALKKMANISEEQAKEITKNETNESVEESKLKRHSTRLFYTIQTANHALRIDALDGSIISKERRK